MNIPDELEPVVDSYPDYEDGTLCFKGTRVLVMHLIMTLTIGLDLEDFLEKEPEVSRELAQAWLDWDDREQAKRGKDDHSHCWALKLFAPSYFPEHPRRTGPEEYFTIEQVEEHFKQRRAEWLEAHPEKQA